MATVIWEGGASVTAQVDTLTPGGTIEATDEFTVTLTDEAGDSTAVTAVAGGTTVADVTAAVVAACSASTNSLFTAVTFADTGTAVTVTANVPGVPFYCAATTTESGGGAADAQTFTRASTTANSGPNDWATAANWSGGSVPTGSDDVIVQDSTYSILYGLRTSTSLASLSRGASFRGDVGDRIAGFDLIVNATTVQVAGGGGVFRMQGSTTDLIIEGTSADRDAVVKGGTSTNVYISGSVCRGQIRFKANSTITNLDVHRVAPTCRVTVDDGNTSPTLVRVGAGRLDYFADGITTLRITGGYVVVQGDATVGTVEVYAGTFDDRTSGTITTLSALGGVTTVANNLAASHTITTLNQLAGETVLRNGLSNTTVTNSTTVFGGQVQLDTGKAIDLNP